MSKKILNRNNEFFSNYQRHVPEDSVSQHQHLFFMSDVARSTWQHFGRILLKLGTANSIQNLLQNWLHGISTRSQLGMVTMAIVFYGCWIMWKRRCTARFEGKKTNTCEVICSIRNQLAKVARQFKSRRLSTKWEDIILEILHYKATKRNTPRGQWLCWSKPMGSICKINTDGAMVQGVTKGSVIIRDERGDVIGGVSRTYSYCYILHAELQAIWDSLILSKDHNLLNFEIETNSLQAYNMICKKTKALWNCIYLLRGIWSLLEQSEGRVKHIYREQNRVADSLAKIQEDGRFTHSKELPINVRHNIFLDRIGIPTFRKHCTRVLFFLVKAGNIF